MTSQMKIGVDEILKIITEHAHAVLPELEGRRLERHDRLVELGANSIDRAEITVRALSSLSLRIPLVSTLQARNVGELAELLHARL